MKYIFLILAINTISLTATEQYVVLQGEKRVQVFYQGNEFNVEKAYLSFPFKVDLSVYSKEALVAYFKEATGTEFSKNGPVFQVFDSMEQLKQTLDYPSKKFNYRVSKPKFRKFEKEFLRNAGNN